MPDPTSSSLAALIGVKVSSVVAGLLGTLVGLSFMAPMSFACRVLTLLGGYAVAHYGSALVLHMHAELMAVEDAVVFFAGVFGMALVKALLDRLPDSVRAFLGGAKQ